MSSKTTVVSLINNNKRNSETELLGDFMICDNASRTDCDVDGSKKQNNTNILKNKSEIPPKNDTPSSEVLFSICEPPRNKKRKLSSLDELLKNLDYGVLYTNLTKLLFFLESDNNKCIFVLTKYYEEFFEMIVQDINILKSKSLDDDYRHISNKIIKAAAGKLLFYIFENNPRLHFRKVMVIKKVHTMDQSENSTASISCSSGSLMPSSQTSTKVETNDKSRSLFSSTITSGFKIHCLRTLLAFIKNDAIKTKEFPELNTDQAKFMQLLLGNVNIDNFDSSREVTELYREVVHAVKINELKYEFRIKCDESWAGKKSVVFQKVPVLILSGSAVKSDQAAGKSKQSVAFKIPVHPSSGSTLNSNQTASKSKETMNPKTNVQNTEDPKTDAPKPDGLNPEFSKPDAPNSKVPKIDVLQPDIAKSNGPKIDVPMADAPKSHGPKIDMLKLDAPKSQAPKTPDSGAPNTSDLGAPNTEPKPLIRTKRQIKYENHLLYLKNTPKKFIENALNTILDFLLNNDMVELVLVPKTPSELKFYRKCIIWCRSGLHLSQFGEQFRELHCRISHLLCRFNVHVTRKGLNTFNEITGIEEVTYVKKPKTSISGSVTCTEAKETSDGGESQSTPKKPKINVQNALQLAATDNIKLDKLINLNQSLRSKKKDKKRKKAELKKAKQSRGASSSSSTSRDSSRDRVKAAMATAFVPPGPTVTKRPSSEISQSPKKTFPSRPSVDTKRNEKLREAMSVPVQSDKAMRMMLGMGWNGGALGPRGDGITEPLMPALEIVSTHHHPPLLIPFYVGPVPFTFVAHTSRFVVRSEARGAGFGLVSHRTKAQNSNPDTVPVAKKSKEPNSPSSFVSGNDIVVEKTKQLLLENVSFDNIFLRDKPSKSTVGLQKPNVEPSKPTSKVQLPTQSGFSIERQKPGNADLELRLPFRMEFLHSIWDLINSDASCKSLKYNRRINKKKRKFVTFAMKTLGSKKDTKQCMFSLEEIPIFKQIRNKYLETQITVEARFFSDYMSIDLLKLPKKFNAPTPMVIENTATITNCNQLMNSENLQSYIFSTNGSTRETLKTIKNMQFKVLFLMSMLKFVKSFDDEYEVTFNKVLNAKEKSYMENVVDQINMRIKFGSSPAETKLGDQIREHVKDAFLGIMYGHEHTIITLSKYYRFKRLNRPDNAVRRKTQATVNLDDFTSETLIEPKLKTDEPFDREIKYDDGEDKYEVSKDTNEVIETDKPQVSTENMTANVCDDETSETLPNSNELRSYDSDDSSIEEYNNNNAIAKVPKLLPGEEGVNISNFLYLYDKDKTNTAGIRNNSIINNDSASKVTDNKNIKNNSGNGNVVIDNNDNQFIDMKRAGDNAQDTQKENNVDSEKAEYIICVDYKEEELKSGDNSIQIDRKEIDLPENVKEDEENSNDAKLVNACKDIGDDDILQINDEVILNTEDLDPTVIVQDIKKDESKTVINIDNSNAVINLNDAVDVINKDKSKVAINPGESMAVIDKDESQAVIDIDKSKAVIDIDESKAAVIKGKKVAQIKEGTSIKINPSDENIVKDDLVINSDCNRIKKDNVVLSEEFCNTQSVKSSLVQTDKDSEIKNVRIGHVRHPIRKLSTEKIEKIQWHISNCIKLAAELPLLKCHGVQNGALFYTCHNKKTYDWLQNTIGVSSYAKVFDTKEVTKMALKLCGYFDFDSNYLFKMLEMYNKEISTKEWVVEKTEKNGDYIIFIVKMDKFSIKFIQKADLALFAGIDKVHFSLIWE